MDESMETFVPLTFRRRGVQRVATDERSVHDVTLLDGVARAFTGSTCWTPARRAGRPSRQAAPSVVNELLRLTLLAPDIIEQFMAGKRPRRLTLMWFQRNHLMVDWQAQRQLMDTFEEDV